MPKISEDTFNLWRMPPSDHEESKLASAEKMVRDAISRNVHLNNLTLEIYGQGSYANDTNVRLNSDVDINVRLSTTVFVEVPVGNTKEDFGYSDSSYTFTQYKQSIKEALISHFGSSNVEPKNKCVRIKETQNRAPADVVPTFKYNWHINDSSVIVGSKFYSDSNVGILNFSLQHIENGKMKNGRTQKRFKRLTRIFKRIRNKMNEDGFYRNENITSFLIECLIWNLPDETFNSYSTWTERIKAGIQYLFKMTSDIQSCKDWVEISEYLYLFHSSRKWSLSEVNEFLKNVWVYLEF